MKSVLVCAAAAAALGALSSPAAAQVDPLAAYYGNTVHETRANGSQMWLLFKSDHTFEGHGSDGRSMAGSFTFDPATRSNCLVIPGRPAGGKAPCAPLPDVKPGESWDRVGPTGQPEHYVLEVGRTVPTTPPGATSSLAPRSPGAVFDAYERAVDTGDVAAVDALVSEHAAKPPFFRCPPQASDRQCLIEYLDGAVVTQHSTLKVIDTRVEGDTVFAKLEVRNDLTKAAGVDRFAGTDKIKTVDGKIVEFAFMRDEQDPQTAKFFQYMMATHRPR